MASIDPAWLKSEPLTRSRVDPVDGTESTPAAHDCTVFDHLMLILADGVSAGKKRTPRTRADINIPSITNDDQASQILKETIPSWLIEVPCGQSYRDAHGLYINLSNLAYGVDLVLQLVIGSDWRQVIDREQCGFKHKFDWKDIVILTSSDSQRVLYARFFRRFGEKIGLSSHPREPLAQVYTFERYESRKSKVTIFWISSEKEKQAISAP